MAEVLVLVEHSEGAVKKVTAELITADETFAKAIPSAVNGVPFRYVDLDTLIHMKRTAGRPVDLEDVRHLEQIAADHE